MKRLLSIVILMAVFMGKAHALEAIEGKPTRKYSVLSPISASKGTTVEKSFADMKTKAEKMGADAIINYSCTAGEAVNGGLLRIRLAGTKATCQGTAIKWQ